MMLVNILILRMFRIKIILYNSSPDCLKTKSVLNLITGKHEKVKPVHIGVMGFACQSKSPANNGRAANSKCLSEGSDAATAVTWRYAKEIIEKFRYQAVMIENVKELEGDGSETSDLSVVLDDLRTMGIQAEVFKVSAVEYGSRVARVRLFILGLRGLNEVNAVRLTVAKDSLA